MNFIADGRVAGAVAGTTTTLGATKTWGWLEFIPDDVGKLATLVGVVLTLVLIFVQLNKLYWETQKNKLDIAEQKARLKREAQTGQYVPVINTDDEPTGLQVSEPE